MTTFANTPSGAIFSPCRTRRFLLWRNWHPVPLCQGSLTSDDRWIPFTSFVPLERWLLCIGLNPSKADEFRSDPTVSQMCGRAKRLGCTGLLMANTSPHVSTDPAGMLAAEDHGEQENLGWITEAAGRASVIIAAWGNLAGERGKTVERLLRTLDVPVHVLGLTGSGAPRHPRGVALTVEPKLWIGVRIIYGPGALSPA